MRSTPLEALGCGDTIVGHHMLGMSCVHHVALVTGSCAPVTNSMAPYM